MWTLWSQISKTSTVGHIVEINWYIIAILNPLQAFLNIFVYRKWSENVNLNFGTLRKWCSAKFKRRNGITYTSQVISERSPLLRLPTLEDETESSEEVEIDTFHRQTIQCNLI